MCLPWGLVGALLLLLRRAPSLPVISTSEGSLHFSEEENRMQEITSQLGWITAERRYGNPRKSSKELSKGRNLRSRTLLRSLFSCF